jgi:hypothetical protein
MDTAGRQEEEEEAEREEGDEQTTPRGSGGVERGPEERAGPEDEVDSGIALVETSLPIMVSTATHINAYLP